MTYHPLKEISSNAIYLLPGYVILETLFMKFVLNGLKKNKNILTFVKKNDE